MQAYKAKGKTDATGNLVVTQPIEIPPGYVEVIILRVADEVTNFIVIRNQKDFPVTTPRILTPE